MSYEFMFASEKIQIKWSKKTGILC